MFEPSGQWLEYYGPRLLESTTYYLVDIRGVDIPGNYRLGKPTVKRKERYCPKR